MEEDKAVTTMTDLVGTTKKVTTTILTLKLTQDTRMILMPVPLEPLPTTLTQTVVVSTTNPQTLTITTNQRVRILRTTKVVATGRVVDTTTKVVITTRVVITIKVVTTTKVTTATEDVEVGGDEVGVATKTFTKAEVVVVETTTITRTKDITSRLTTHKVDKVEVLITTMKEERVVITDTCPKRGGLLTMSTDFWSLPELFELSSVRAVKR